MRANLKIRSVRLSDLLNIACGRANRRLRIVGGSVVELNEYPWQAAIVKTGDSEPFCGATLMSDEWVLTAAHCTDG